MSFAFYSISDVYKGGCIFLSVLWFGKGCFVLLGVF